MSIDPHRGTTIDLSNSYVNLDHIQSLYTQYEPLYEQHAALHSSSSSSPPPLTQSLSHSPALPSHLTLESSILPPLTTDALAQLQSFLLLLSPSLISINLSKSNVTGRLFYRGHEITLTASDAEKSLVFIEGRQSATGRAIVRDDDPPLLISGRQNPSTTHRYVSTQYNATNGTFSRLYATMGWLRLLECNVSASDLSSHGLNTLLCCTGTTLQVLRLNDCPHIDNSGLFTVTQLCRQLLALEVNNCPLLTEHALMAISDMPQPCIAQLSLLSTCQPRIPNSFFHALLHALEDKGFTGQLLYDATEPRQVRGRPARLSERIDKGKVVDLTFSDVTHQSLKLLTEEQRAGFTDRKEALLKRMTAHQRAMHAKLTSELPPPPQAYLLDLTQHHYINDTLLHIILQQFGPSLYVLKLSHTFVTSNGLSSLKLCPHLRVLSLSSCHSLTDKSTANRVMMEVLERMPMLMELNISDSRLSGRMLSAHPMLALFTFYAHACTISSRALRLLSESCALSLSVLSLAHCPFVNRLCLLYIQRLHQLVVLDISYCQSLTAKDVRELDRYEGTEIRRIDVRGIHGVTRELCTRIEDAIMSHKRSMRGAMAESVQVVGGEEALARPPLHSSLSSPAALSSAGNFNYAVVTPMRHSSLASPTEADEDGGRERKQSGDTDGRMRYEGVSVEEKRDTSDDREEGLYTVLSQNYVIAPPPPIINTDSPAGDDFASISLSSSTSASSLSTSHHQRSVSAAATFRPSNPTPSSTSLPLNAWSSTKTTRLPARQLSQTLPRPLPASQAESSLPAPSALTPSASSSTGSSASASPFPVSSTADVSPIQSASHPSRHRSHVSLPGSPNTQRLMEGMGSPPPLQVSPTADYAVVNYEVVTSNGRPGAEVAEKALRQTVTAYTTVDDDGEDEVEGDSADESEEADEG